MQQRAANLSGVEFVVVLDEADRMLSTWDFLPPISANHEGHCRTKRQNPHVFPPAFRFHVKIEAIDPSVFRQ